MIETQHDIPARKLLAAFREKGAGNEPFSESDLRGLLALCSNPAEDIREAALILLLQPSAEDEIRHCRRLLPFLLKASSKGKRLPAALEDYLCEWVAFLGKIPDDPEFKEPFARFLRKLPGPSLDRLFSRRFPATPFLGSLRATAAPRGGKSDGPMHFKRRWRLLLRRIRTAEAGGANGNADAIEAAKKTEASHGWAAITLADLRPLFLQRRRDNRSRFRNGRWIAAGRPLFLPPAGDNVIDLALQKRGIRVRATSRKTSCALRAPGQQVARAARKECEYGSKLAESTTLTPLVGGPGNARWGSAGNLTLRYLGACLRAQAEELRAVRDLAMKVSERTRRVVFSWHNASLAAAGGWAFEELRQAFPSALVYGDFVQAVERRVLSMEREYGASPAPSVLGGRKDLQALLKEREARLVTPKVLHALREGRVRCAFDSSSGPEWEKQRRAAEDFLGRELMSELGGGEKFGWNGAVSPHQETRIEDILAWAASQRKTWGRGMMRMAALALEGQRLLDEGVLPALALPWIDKFFISSRREEDWRYTVSLLQWFRDQGPPPLVLFWDDTSHAERPSLQLALRRMEEEGCPCRGVGVFDWTGATKREDALEIVSREHARVSLFALRPVSDVHTPISFHRMLSRRDYGFFRRYDSSWKDDLCFLYAGTRVFPLLSIQGEMETFSPWTAGSGRRRPFGAYFREELQRLALGDFEPGEDAFSLDCASWANLR